MDTKLKLCKKLNLKIIHKTNFYLNKIYCLAKFALPYHEPLRHYSVYVENLNNNKSYEAIIYYCQNYNSNSNINDGSLEIYLTKNLSGIDFRLFFFNVKNHYYILAYHYQFNYSLILYYTAKIRGEERLCMNATPWIPYLQLIERYSNKELLKNLDLIHSKTVLLGGRTLTEKFCEEEGWNGK